MALTKVTKHIVYGSVLIAHYGKDFSNVTNNSSTFVQWGDNTTVTPQYSDSHLELVCTGSAQLTSSGAGVAGYHSGMAKFVVNGSDEYIQKGIIGTNQSRGGNHNHQNQQFGEGNGRQNWRHYGMGTAIYMNHIHAPGSTAAQEVGTWVAMENTSATVSFQDGFITISEIAGEHYNLT